MAASALKLICLLCVAAVPAGFFHRGLAQQAPGIVPGTLAPVPNRPITPLVTPTLTPGVIHLMELESQFQQAVAAGGGKAFASWFADDGVTLSEGQPAVVGRAAIAVQARWDPQDYQLTWIPEGAETGPSNDMGFTWGRYQGRTKGKGGEPAVTTGRYMTVWKRLTDGSWKVALEASAAAPPDPAACCTVPRS